MGYTLGMSKATTQYEIKGLIRRACSFAGIDFEVVLIMVWVYIGLC